MRVTRCGAAARCFRAGAARRLAAAAALGTACAAGAADWPQWRGPGRDGISSEKNWVSRFPPGGPRRAWEARVGQGWSSVAVWGGRVYTIGNANNQDTVVCLSAETGRTSWKYSYPCQGGDYGGPRATPVVSGGQVFTLSREGHALCLNATTGGVVWRTDLRRATGAETPRWGFAGSPLVGSRLVVYNVGEAGAALDRGTGRLVWKSGPGPGGYASPVAFAAGSQRGVLLFSAPGLIGVEPGSGREFWRVPWNTSYDVNAADPVVSGSEVFISSNYGRGGALINMAGGRPSIVWQNRTMRNHFNASVLVDGHLYGNDENTLKCMDLRTGTERWRSRGIGKGGLIAAGDRLIVLTERGELLIASATPQRYVELARAQVLRGTCWTHPVLANGFIYCRSHEGTLVCLDVRAAG